MNKDTEIDMKEVELNELDPEKQPMTGDGQAPGGEKNGSVKLKVPDDEVTFTGLSKEELMKVAGTPGWVRTRWVLLVLFWLGWIGMLAGAIVIIVQAPRCKSIPEMNWWNEGPLYQITDLAAFSGGLKGVEEKLDDINQLKVKSLVIGPLHTVQANQKITLNLQKISPEFGNAEDLDSLLKAAHKKSISVVLDLTPNYEGNPVWFDEKDRKEIMEKVKAAAEYWLEKGVDGIKISDLGIASTSPEWAKLRMAVQGNGTDDTKKRALMGVVNSISADEVSQLVNVSGVDLILSDLLSRNTGGKERIRDLETLHSEQRKIGWGLGAAQKDHLSKQATTRGLIRLYQLLLFTLPGTPVFTYGDEIGLQANQMSNKTNQTREAPKMVWNVEKEETDGAKSNHTEYAEIRKWFRSLSDLRGKERSLLHGDYYSLYSSATSLSFLRVWDQSERYITAVNWGDGLEELKLNLAPTEGVELPETAKVTLSTDQEFEVDSTVNLKDLTLKAGQALLLQFPYTG
ncbi:solute carrier family 3 member 2a [Oreochromis aureus]|uniref:Glycosyl hydrolase family 13 catalytic domain-containing protein n=1 Tax=Oreochromis aureus TaxID=47969 RepID=A0AAZ1X037_OREAU|nr:solute carrier family 3 member 2a [Oreochromis aureus]XP_031592607.2 solute carrier family 3 member 2a [Oreochromis aureus]XP_039465560.1 solute carrier family 3 member 2a [Oreochromis aureus]